MSESVSKEDLMRYLDGETTPEERASIEVSLERSTEAMRELALFRSLQGEMQRLSFAPSRHRSVWDRVNARLTRPIGWILMITGAAVWLAYGGYMYFNSSIDVWEKVGTGAILVGLIALLGTVFYDRYRDWLTDPYRDVYR